MNIYEFNAKVRLLVPGNNETDATIVAQDVVGAVRLELSEAVDKGHPVLSASIETGGKPKMLPCEMETVENMTRQPALFGGEQT